MSLEKTIFFIIIVFYIFQWHLYFLIPKQNNFWVIVVELCWHFFFQNFFWFFFHFGIKLNYIVRLGELRTKGTISVILSPLRGCVVYYKGKGFHIYNIIVTDRCNLHGGNSPNAITDNVRICARWCRRTCFRVVFLLFSGSCPVYI